MINRIQNKSFGLHNICMCTVYIYHVYRNTHTYSKYFENIYILIFYIEHIHSCVCISINNYIKLILDAINRLTALVFFPYMM